MPERADLAGNSSATDPPEIARIFAASSDPEAVAREIGERLRALLEARSSAVFKSVFEDSAIGMAIAGLDGRFLRVNGAFSRLLGYSEEELLATTVGGVTCPEDRDADREDDRRLLGGEARGLQREKRYLHKLGHAIWVLASVSLVRTAAGQPMYFIVQVQDIGERKRTEAERLELEEQLRHSQKMEAVGRLAGGVAHDFNNLLTVITGRGQLLLARLHPADPVHRDVELIHKTAQRAAGLTHQLLAFSRKQVLQPRVVDLNALVGRMGTMLRRWIGEDIELVMDLTPGLWPVKTDPGQIEQVVLNLVMNARDAMPDGGTLTLGTENAELGEAFVLRHPGATMGPHVVLTVRDTGCGMDTETQAHAFEPFFTTKRVGGTGLGLSTVYGIVKQHQGHIGVESAVGEGTRFRIYFPRAPEEAEPVEERRGAMAAPTGTETVLVVEDEAEVRDLTCEVLEAKGYRVLEATDGPAALEVCRQYGGSIHLLLTDVVMPRMSGRELADRVAAVRPETRVLYVSGYADDALGHRGVLDPGVILLQKPFTPARLVEKVRQALDEAPGSGRRAYR